MTVSAASQLAALLAAGTGAAGLYFDSMSALALAGLLATGSVFAWARSTAPHDHWRQFKRRHPWEP
jgi:hypothetical protein